MTRPPWDYEWVYGDAPPPHVEGVKIVVWQPPGFLGVAVSVDGFWRDDRNRAPWGAGVPRGWWAYMAVPRGS